MSKPVIAIDVDEVLAYFIPHIAEYYNLLLSYREPNQEVRKYNASSFFTMDFHEVWGIPVEEVNSIVDSFFKSEVLNLQPIEGALETLQKLKYSYDLHIVTARQNKVELDTRKWIEKHYPNIFTQIHFGNHYSPTERAIPKSELCKKINAIVLVDDSLRYATDCSTNGIPCVLFGEYAWNKSPPNTELPKLVHRVSNWRDVESAIYKALSLKTANYYQLPIGWEARGNSNVVDPQSNSLVDKVGDWSYNNLVSKYRADNLDTASSTVPIGFGKSRLNSKTPEELNLEKSATAVAVAQVHLNKFNPDEIAYIAKPKTNILSAGSNFDDSLDLKNDNITASYCLEDKSNDLTKLLGNFIIQMNSKFIEIECKLNDLTEGQNKIIKAIEILSSSNK